MVYREPGYRHGSIILHMRQTNLAWLGLFGLQSKPVDISLYRHACDPICAIRHRVACACDPSQRTLAWIVTHAIQVRIAKTGLFS